MGGKGRGGVRRLCVVCVVFRMWAGVDVGEVGRGGEMGCGLLRACVCVEKKKL